MRLPIALVAGVGHMLSASAARSLAKPLDGRTDGVLHPRIVNHAAQGISVYIIRTLAREEFPKYGEEHHAGDTQTGHYNRRITGRLRVLLNLLANRTHIRGDLGVLLRLLQCPAAAPSCISNIFI